MRHLVSCGWATCLRCVVQALLEETLEEEPGGVGGWKGEVSLTSTLDSCSWISKNICECHLSEWKQVHIIVIVNRTNQSRLGYIIMNMFYRPVWMKFVVWPQCYKKSWRQSLCPQERGKKARWDVDAGSPFPPCLSASPSLSTLAHAGPSPWQRMRKQVLLLKSQTLGSTLIWEGCDKQPEPEPKALQISQHRGRSFAARGNQDLI